MEGGAEGASTTNSNAGGEGGQETPLTSTQSGLPIAQVYAGAGYFSSMIRSRRQQFHETQQNYRRPEYANNTRNPYVSPMRGPRGGIDQKRQMSGLGVGYTDALDLFKDQKSGIDKRSNGVVRRYRQQDPMRRRQQGIRSYEEQNPSNKDGI
jgi:hypothetical protein